MVSVSQPIIPIKVYRFYFQKVNTARLPEYPGSAWRGAFGHALKKTVCVVRNTPCNQCLLKNACAYPDVLVDCSKMSGADVFSSSPVIIVEVLSRSTRKTDTTTKLIRYINLPSLQEYLLIEPDIESVQVLRRGKNWLPEYFFLGDEVTFESIGLTLPVEDIYDRVDNPDINEHKAAKPM